MSIFNLVYFTREKLNQKVLINAFGYISVTLKTEKNIY